MVAFCKRNTSAVGYIDFIVHDLADTNNSPVLSKNEKYD